MLTDGLCVVNNAGTMKTTVSGKLLDGRLAVLGAGKIGGILLRAFLEPEPRATEPRAPKVAPRRKAAPLAKQWDEASTDIARRCEARTSCWLA